MIYFDYGKIYEDDRELSAAEAMDIIVHLQRKNERLEGEIEELYKRFTGYSGKRQDIRRELSETR